MADTSETDNGSVPTLYSMCRSVLSRMAQRAIVAVDQVKGALKLKKKPNDKKCDFTIICGGESIKVHRSKLLKHTDYFNKRYPPSFVEEQNCCHETGTSFETITMCIRYVYKSDIWLSLKNVGAVLTLARKWRMDSLVQVCDDYVRGQVNPKSCVQVKKLGQEIGDKDIEKLADTYILANLGEVAQGGEVGELTEAEIRAIFTGYVGPFDDFGVPILKTKDEVLWRLVTAWVEGNYEKTVQFCEIFQDMPFSFHNTALIEKYMLEDPLIADCEGCSEYVARNLLDVFDHRIDFLNSVKEFGTEETFCTPEEAFFIQSIAQKHDRQNIVKKISECMECNFAEFTKRDEYKNLEKDDFTRCIRSSKLTPEEKWSVIKEWTNHIPERAAFFHNIFKLVGVDELSQDFIRNTIMNDKMVQISPECKDMILESLLKRRTS